MMSLFLFISKVNLFLITRQIRTIFYLPKEVTTFLRLIISTQHSFKNLIIPINYATNEIKKGMVTLQVNDKRSQGVDNSRHIKLFKNLLVFHCHFCYNKLYF